MPKADALADGKRVAFVAELVAGRQVTGAIEWSSSDPEVASVAAGVVSPVKDGTDTITAKAGEHTATARVVVSGMGREFAWSFRNHVEPVLAKQGCNSGACHGALAGKGGFRLSLNGFDPASDYFNIVKLERGRRVEPVCISRFTISGRRSISNLWPCR